MKIFKSIIESLKLCFETVGKVFQENFPSSDIMSKEAREILSNPDDAKRYVEAIRRLHSGETKEELFERSNGKKIKLILINGPTIINPKEIKFK